MVVVTHQAIGMHLPIGFLARFGQRLDEIVPIHIVQKNVLAPVSPAHHMVHGTWIFNASFARHDRFINSMTLVVNARMDHAMGDPFSGEKDRQQLLHKLNLVCF
jgi:hypothetical protein